MIFIAGGGCCNGVDMAIACLRIAQLKAIWCNPSRLFSRQMRVLGKTMVTAYVEPEI